MNRKGIALILGFFVMVAFAALSATIFSRSITKSNLTRRHKESTQAFWLAEAGVERAFWELNHGGEAWTGWNTDAGGNKTLSTTLGSFGNYSVQVIDPLDIYPTIMATGLSPISGEHITRTIEVDVEIQTSSPFTHAAFGKTSLSMAGNGITDSYNSDKGSYGGDNVSACGSKGVAVTPVGSEHMFEVVQADKIGSSRRQDVIVCEGQPKRHHHRNQSKKQKP